MALRIFLSDLSALLKKSTSGRHMALPSTLTNVLSIELYGCFCVT
jgi:hypothetical protein